MDSTLCRRPRPLSALLLTGMILSFPALAESPAWQDWDAKVQGTYIWQRKAAFPASYSGPNSLTNDRELSYTFTATAFLGARPWRGGEIYLNAEVGQGVPFSGLTGLGGFTNGEVTRTAGTNPKVYRQRLFLRQTWNLGGGTEKIASDFNQLAGTVDKNRFVLTVVNFSTLDVFDDNAYAKDPRTQFMNWGNMTYAAYDYAADARGFGWGFAGEWHQGEWVLRFGRMTGPKEPNMLPSDYAIGRHYGDQVEIEHAHALGGQPGKVRVLAWRDKARLASFQDALDYLNAHPGADPQTLFQARNSDKVKYGLGINVEQAIGDNLGIFLRAMKADGKTETLAFTEVDGSLSAGLSLKGAAWGRPQDTFGLAVLRNALSPERRRYLEAGGISFFIGDGRLNYRPETFVETYYNWNPAKHFWLTADYQRIWNPAYNADRGPVNIAGLRLHLEY